MRMAQVKMDVLSDRISRWRDHLPRELGWGWAVFS